MSEELNNTEKTVTEETSPSQENLPHHLQVEEYGEGHIHARHGRIRPGNRYAAILSTVVRVCVS